MSLQGVDYEARCTMTDWMREALALQDRRNELLAMRLDTVGFCIVGHLAGILEWTFMVEALAHPYKRED